MSKLILVLCLVVLSFLTSNSVHAASTDPLAGVPGVDTNGTCICGVQDLTKKDDNPKYVEVSSIGNNLGCSEKSAQEAYGSNIKITNCIWKSNQGANGTEKAEALCVCKDKQTGQKIEKKKDVIYSFKLNSTANEKGVLFAMEGQQYCSSISTTQLSCVFVDAVFGSGNIKPADPNLTAYAKELNFLGSTDIRIVIGRAIKVIMGIAGSIAFAMFVYGGFQYMTGQGTPLSEGSKSKVQEGKRTITWATLGIFIIFASYTIISFIFEAVT